MGDLARHSDNCAKALYLFETAATLDPGHFWTINDIASLLQQFGRHKDAESICYPLQRNFLVRGFALTTYAKGLRYRASARELLTLFEKAASIDPRDPDTKTALAEEYVNNCRLDEAQVLF